MNWGTDRVRFNVHTGSGFQSKDPFLFGQLSLKVKLVPGDSSGVVVCFYVSITLQDL